MRRLILALVSVLTCVSAVSAQERIVRAPAAPAFLSAPIGAPVMQVPPVVNPNGVGILASPDHSTVENGVNLVTKYTMDFFKTTAPTVVVRSVDIGKPTPDGSNIIKYMQLAQVRAALTTGDYTAVAYAEGPGGRTASVVSDPFTVTPRAAGATGKPVWIQ